MKNVKCDKDDRKISDCAISFDIADGCSHQYDIWLHCIGKMISRAEVGVIYIPSYQLSIEPMEKFKSRNLHGHHAICGLYLLDCTCQLL